MTEATATKLPDFVRHQWCLLVQVPLTESEASRVLVTGKLDRLIEAKDVKFSGAGCFVCEEGLSHKTFLSECPGEPKE